MTDVTLGQWECFQDASYYDMWCVRQVHDRTFGHGFHLVNGEEAARLRDHLNTRPASIEAEKRTAPHSVVATDAMVEAAWQAYDNSTKPAPFNQMRDAINAALASLTTDDALVEELRAKKVERITKAILFEDCGSTEHWEDNVNLGDAVLRALEGER